MRMIVLFAFAFRQWPLSRHPRPAGSDQRVVVDVRGTRETVLREEFTVHFHGDFLRPLLHGDGAESGESEKVAKSGEDGSWEGTHRGSARFIERFPARSTETTIPPVECLEKCCS